MDKDEAQALENLRNIICAIVNEAKVLKDKHTKETDAPVNYACIFSQSQAEYESLLKVANITGKVIKETPTGLLFHINTLDTSVGPLKLLKIRIPDPSRPEKGDADFTVDDYQNFKDKYLLLPGFSLIERENFEMIEIVDPSFNVRAYFSNPPLDKQLGI